MKVTCICPRSKFDYSQYLPNQTICRVDEKGTSGEQAQVSSLPQELSLNLNSSISLLANLKISYALPKNGRAKLSLYDITGRRIMELVNMVQQAGYYKNTLDLQKAQLTNGVYFLVLELDSDKKFKKITLIR